MKFYVRSFWKRVKREKNLGMAEKLFEWALNRKFAAIFKMIQFHSCHFLSIRVFWSKNESHCEKEFPIKAASGFDLQLFVLIPSLTQQVRTVLNFLSLAKWTWLYLLVGNSKQAAAWMGAGNQTFHQVLLPSRISWSILVAKDYLTGVQCTI